MKKFLLIAILALAGCSTAPERVAQNSPAATTNPGNESFNQNQMSKTGRQTPGGALEQLDPSVTVQNGHQ
ncbi:MAG TPA: hypothetical protein VGG02_04515 [Chthoniobacterales bacterium]|jgi:uncharacterized lipoprotein YajG